MAEDAPVPAGTPPRPKRKFPYGEPSAEALSPLAPYAGERPPAPVWFDTALAEAPEQTFVDSLGGRIELLTWGERGKPGLLLIHGTGAHAHWWAFIAPFLAKTYRVAAMSLAGMGASDWRERYTTADVAEDAEACARAAGLYDDGQAPIYVGHSMGGAMAFSAAVAHPERMRAAVIVDTSFRAPGPKAIEEMRVALDARRAASGGVRAERVYATEAEALARFRVAPPQVVSEHYIVDYIARTALRPTPRPEGGMGFAWRHDPAHWVKLEPGGERGPYPDGPIRPAVPLVHIHGDRSHVATTNLEPLSTPLAPEVPVIVIPDCGHHIMIDQPVALVATLRTLLSVWPA